MPSFPTLTTQRLNLRQLSNSDVQEVFALRSDPAINKYLDRAPCNSLEDALKFIEAIRQNSATYWAITEKDNDTLVGTICLFDLNDALKRCEIGYELLTAHQGKGIMLEAARAVLAHAVQTLGMHTIHAYTHMENISSSKLLEALGFDRTNLVDAENEKVVLYKLDVTDVPDGL